MLTVEGKEGREVAEGRGGGAGRGGREKEIHIQTHRTDR